MKKPAENNIDQYIQERYREAINYYWLASRYNKRWYKVTRILTIVFGAFVTLIASLSSSTLLLEHSTTQALFQLGTPVLAALLTMIAGFSQNFQWGTTWQNMTITAQELQRELDTYLATPLEERNYSEAIDKLNGFVLIETRGFFERILGSIKVYSSKDKVEQPAE